MHHHPSNHERAINLSILLMSGPGKFSRVELVKFLKAMRDTPNFPPHSAAALKLLLALGVRKMELLTATWNQFDLKAGEWHIPKEQTKTEEAIRIPLSPWVVGILKEQKARGHNAYVFPVQRIAPGKLTGYMGETTLNHALYMLQSDLEPFTVHDLTSVYTCFWSNINNIIRCIYCVFVVFHNQNSVSEIAKIE